MTKKKMSKKSKRRLILLGPLSIVVIVFSCISCITYLGKMKGLSDEEKRLKNDLVQLEQEASHLNTEIIKLNDPDYIARYAREKFLYSKDGEIVFKLEKPSEITKEEENLDNREYLIYGSIVCGVILFIILIKIILKKPKEENKKKLSTNT